MNHGAIPVAQHEFIMGKFCFRNPSLFLEEVVKHLDESHRSEVCYIGFRRAFDSVSRNQSDHKVKALRVTGRTSTWETSFFRRRTFNIRVGGYVNAPADMSGDVPLLSVLGPPLLHSSMT